MKLLLLEHACGSHIQDHFNVLVVCRAYIQEKVLIAINVTIFAVFEKNISYMHM